MLVDKTMQIHSLTSLISSKARLYIAARQCGLRRGRAGVDGVDWKSYRRQLNANLSRLSRTLASGDWRPSGYSTIEVSSFTGKTFVAHCPTFEDRIVHRVIKSVLQPIADRYLFKDFASGWRASRNRLTALRRASEYLADYGTVVSFDIPCGTIGFSRLAAFETLKRIVKDRTLLGYIEAIFEPLPSIVSAGTGLSPFMTNVCLTEIDELLEALPVVRFGDDYVIFCHGEEEGKATISNVVRSMSERSLKLAQDRFSLINKPNLEDLFLL